MQCGSAQKNYGGGAFFDVQRDALRFCFFVHGLSACIIAKVVSREAEC